MKKFLLVAAACLLPFVTRAHGSQGLLLKNYLSIVPELGVNATSLLSISSNSEYGFYGGVGIRIGKRKHLYTGAYYKMLRLQMGNDTSSIGFSPVRSSYLTIPVMFGYSLVDEKMLKVRVYGGVLYNRFLSAIVPENTASWDFREDLWGARAGVGINIWRIEANASYDFSVAKMFVNGNAARPHGYNLSLGFRF